MYHKIDKIKYFPQFFSDCRRKKEQKQKHVPNVTSKNHHRIKKHYDVDHYWETQHVLQRARGE